MTDDIDPIPEHNFSIVLTITLFIMTVVGCAFIMVGLLLAFAH